MEQNFPFDLFLNVQQPPVNINGVEQNKLVNQNTQSTQISSDELNSIVEEILQVLKKTVPEVKFNTFFVGNIEIKDIIANTIIFNAKSNFIKKNLVAHYNDISYAVKNVLGKEFALEFHLPITNENTETNIPSIIIDDKKSRTVLENKFKIELTPTKEDLLSKAHAQYIEHMNSGQNGIIIDKNKTFDNFIVGPTNNMAQAAARAVAELPGKNGKYPSLYIHSSSGLGKTHLLHAVANEINDRYPNQTVCLITARDFMEEMIELVKKNRINEFVKKYTEKVDVLMIDDIHELKNKEGTQDQFFHVFNEMHNKGKQLIFTSDKRPKEIDGISERIKTRLQWGLTVDIKPPDLETRIAILRKKMEDLELFLTEDILTYIASKVKNNIRALEGSLVQLKAYSDLMNVELELDLVKETLKLSSEEEEKIVTIDQIAKATAQYFKIPLADLKSKSRNQDITRARHIAMYLSRIVANAKQQEIGSFFGGRDHSSVIHAVSKVKEDIKNDSSLSKDINSIESNL